MAVKIRLKRNGRHNIASYRIFVAYSRSPRDRRFIEEIGTYQTLLKEKLVVLNKESAIAWLKKGAQPTETVRDILSTLGIMEALHKEKQSKKKA